MSLVISQAAQAHLRHWLLESKASMLHLYLEQKGCSGWQYVCQPVLEKPEHCLTCQVEDLLLCIPSQQWAKMHGTRIDLQQLALGQTRLLFENPRASGHCGCGESFNWQEA